MAITPDGLTIFVGAPFTNNEDGVVFIFRASSISGPWIEDATPLVPSVTGNYDQFGGVLVATASTVVISGSYGTDSGTVNVFYRQADGSYVADASNPYTSAVADSFFGGAVCCRSSYLYAHGQSLTRARNVARNYDRRNDVCDIGIALERSRSVCVQLPVSDLDLLAQCTIATASRDGFRGIIGLGNLGRRHHLCQ